MELLLPLNLASGLAGYRWNSSALLLVTDYMCLIQEAFPAIRFEWRFSFCFFILNLNFIVLTKESCLKKDSLGILFFYEILLTNWGLICVRCYFNFDIKFYCKKLYNIYMEHSTLIWPFDCKFSMSDIFCDGKKSWFWRFSRTNHFSFG